MKKLLLIKIILLVSSFCVYSKSTISFEVVDFYPTNINTFENLYLNKISETKYWHIYFQELYDKNEIHVISIDSAKIIVDKSKYDDCGEFFYYTPFDFSIQEMEYIDNEMLGIYTYKFMFIYDIKNRTKSFFDYFKNGLQESKDNYIYKNKRTSDIYLINQYDQGQTIYLYELNKSKMKWEKYNVPNSNNELYLATYDFIDEKIMLYLSNNKSSSLKIYDKSKHKIINDFVLPLYNSQTRYSNFKYDKRTKLLWASGNYYDINNQFVQFINFSTNYGKTWQNTFKSYMLQKPQNLGASITILEFVGNTIFALSWNSDYILKSDNYGKSWELEKIQNIKDNFYSPEKNQYYQIDTNKYLIPISNNHLYSVKIENYDNNDSLNMPNENLDTVVTTNIFQNINLNLVEIRGFRNQFELISNSDYLGLQIVEIYNQNGVLVSINKFDKVVQNEIHSFQIKLPIGVYFALIKEGENFITNKILIYE